MTQSRFADDYARELADHVRCPRERGLYVGYQLGRRAVREQIGLLDLLTIHHHAWARMFGDATEAPAREPLESAARFVTQSLASYEMIQRAADEAVQAAADGSRNAELLRQLSALLADASLAHDDGTSLREMLAVVAEQARELCEAERCSVVLDGRPPLGASDPPWDTSSLAGDRRTVELTTLAGDRVGEVTLERSGPAFTPRQQGLLEQVAQMLEAAIERHGRYPA